MAIDNIINFFFSNLKFAPTYSELEAENAALVDENRNLVDELVEETSDGIDALVEIRNLHQDIDELETLIDEQEEAIEDLADELAVLKENFSVVLLKLIEVCLDDQATLELNIR